MSPESPSSYSEAPAPPEATYPTSDPQFPENPAPRRRNWVWPTVLIILAVLGGGGWFLFSKLMGAMAGGQGHQAVRITPVKTMAVKSTPIENSSDYVASLASRQSVTLQPRVAGQVSQIYVKAGDRVTAGQTLLQIDPREQQATVVNRQAAVEASQAEVEAARSDAASARQSLQSLQARRAASLSNLEFNQRDYQRNQELFNEGAISRQVLDQRLNSLQTAQAAVAQIDADIQAQRAAIARAEANIARNRQSVNQAEASVVEEQAALGFYTITAPFDGIVGNIPVKEGDFANTSTQLMTLTQNRELEVQISVPVEDAPKLRNGLTVRLLDANNKPLQTGRLSFVSPNVNPQTQSVLAKAVFENAAGQLRTEQFVRARIIWNRYQGVTVPIDKITRQAGENFVFVPEAYRDRCQAISQEAKKPSSLAPEQLVAGQRAIKVGRVVGNNQEVLEGLRSGEKIVVEGALQLTDCAPITDKPPQMPR